jgi:hypothetical protein
MTPVRLDATRAGEKDTRGLNFTNILPPGDTLASITSIAVVRRDGVSIGADDLTITPSGAVGPFIDASATGIAAVVAGWWHGSGATIAGTPIAPTPVDYQGTVTVVSTLGRTIVRDFYILVVPGLG